MCLANVQTFRSNVWRPNRVLAVPQIDSICDEDRKMDWCGVAVRCVDMLQLRILLFVEHVAHVHSDST